jgi:hypothetical protein
VVRALNNDIVWHFFGQLHLLDVGRYRLLLLLAWSLELQQRHSFRYTYYMYMRRMNTMNA